VEVQDAPWQGPAGVAIKTEGEPGARFSSIPKGENVTLSYRVVPQAKGVLFGAPARITYRSSVSAVESQVGASTGVQMEVISRSERWAQKALYAGAFLSLGLLQSKAAWANTGVLIAILAVVLGGSSLHANAKRNSKRRRQIKAEQELMKE
jgi:Translocon-associated protein beta (TRAPB)